MHPQMPDWTRRHFITACLAAGASASLTSPAGASIARALTLEELSQGSRHVLVGTPLQASGRWETIAGRRRIVTYSRVRVEELFAGADPEQTEVLVRTLGGRVGDIGQIVHGEAVLELNQPCVLFIGGNTGPLYVQGMSQGEYPVIPVRGERKLSLSPRLAELRGDARSAAARLNRTSLTEAKRRIQEASR